MMGDNMNENNNNNINPDIKPNMSINNEEPENVSQLGNNQMDSEPVGELPSLNTVVQTENVSSLEVGSQPIQPDSFEDGSYRNKTVNVGDGTKKNGTIKSFYKKSRKKYKRLKYNINQYKKGFYLEYSYRLMIYAVLTVLLIVAGIFLIKRSYSLEVGDLVNYKEQGTADYRVFLKDNDFYDQNSLDKGKAYISSLIDYIKVDYKYSFHTNTPLDLKVNYSIMAKLTITDQTGSNVYYEKEYTLLNQVNDSKKKSQMYSFNESVKVNFDYYNTLATKFKSSYGVDAVSNLTVYAKVYRSLPTLNKNSTDKILLTIPLTQKAIQLTTKNIDKKDNFVLNSKVNLDHRTQMTIGIVMILVAFLCLYRLIRLLIVANKKKMSPYDKYLDRLFKEYDRLIVETKTPPRFDDMNIIKIMKFEELMDARDTLKQPIMYYNISSHNKCYFFIKHDDDVYLTVIKAVDVESGDYK